MKAVNGGNLSDMTVREVHIAEAYEREIERLNTIIDELNRDRQRLYDELKKGKE